MRDARKLESRDTALPWIYRVATNHCLNLRRNAGRRGEEALPEIEMAAPETPEAVPERQLVQRVLARFDAKTQAVGGGGFVGGMEDEEGADGVGGSRPGLAAEAERLGGHG